MKRSPARLVTATAVSSLCWLVLFWASVQSYKTSKQSKRLASVALGKRHTSSPGRVLVSYAYYEKDAVQQQNLDFFLSVGLGLGQADGQCTPGALRADVIITVADSVCTPCSRLRPCLRQHVRAGSMPELARPAQQTTPPARHAGTTRSTPRALPGTTTVLWRRDNVGMDFASHNVSLAWVRSQRATYRYIIFLNSSVRGPFIPAYMPPWWQWTQAFTDRLDAGHSLVACSLTCLPDVDAGGPGPRAESWAFALDGRGLNAAVQRGVFDVRECKLCDDGIVVAGEYGLSKAVLAANLSLTTLLYRYRDDTDWSQPGNWNCNDNAHPSRQGTYGGVSQHPFEILFVKASWGVGEPYTSTYTEWSRNKIEGTDTKGRFDERAYRKAIS